MSEAGLRLSCLDCQQSGLALQEVMPHAERHWLTCDQCQQFRPIAGTLDARQIMLQNHTQSQCTHYRGQVLATPLMDNTLTLFRFMIRFGTEETLLDLLQQFDLPIDAEDLNQTDRNHRTVLHDLAQYTSPAVIRSFLQRFKHWVTAELIQLPDNYRWTSAHYLFQYQSEKTIIEFIQSNGKMITWELQSRQNDLGSTPLHILYHRNFFRAVAEVFQRLQNQAGRPVNEDLAMQDFSGVNLLHILFASGNTPLIYHFIDQHYDLMTSDMLWCEKAGNDETPLHILFKQGSSSTIQRLIDGCYGSIRLNKLLGKKRATDGYTPLHLLFARGDISLTKALLDNLGRCIHRREALKTNRAGVSVLQMLLQKASPIAALSWLCLVNSKHEQFLKPLLETNPELSWDELLDQAGQLRVMTPQLNWLKKEREKLEPSIVGISAPLSEPLASTRLDPGSSAPPLLVPEEDEPGLFESSQDTKSLEAPKPVISKATTSEVSIAKAEKSSDVISITEKSIVTVASGENQLHEIARNSSTEDIAAIFERNAETITPAMLSKANIAGRTPFHILVDRSISAGTILSWLLHGLSDAVANELLDKDLFSEHSWRQLYDYTRVSPYLEKDLKLKQVLELLKPIFNQEPTSSEMAASPSTQEFSDAVAHIECPICMEAMAENVAATPCCGQLFHKDCITRWVKGKKQCSLCRKSISANQLTTIRLPDIVVTKVFDARPKVKPEEKSSSPDGAKGFAFGVEPDFKAGMQLETTDKMGDTPLPHLATGQGQTDTVEAKVLSDIDRIIRFWDFNVAARNGNTWLIRESLKVDPSLAKEKANDGSTALHSAARNGQLETIQTLLNFDPSLAKEKDNYGCTALHLAAYNGHTEAIQTLLNFDPSLAKEKDNYGCTALHFASECGHLKATQTLLKFDRSLAKEKDYYGNTALHKAVSNFWGHTVVIQTLLKFDRSLAKEKDNYGETALHKAAREGCTADIRTLLNFDRSLAKEKDNDGKTALDFAIKCGHRKCKKLLEDYGAQPSGSLQQ